MILKVDHDLEIMILRIKLKDSDCGPVTLRIKTKMGKNRTLSMIFGPYIRNQEKKLNQISTKSQFQKSFLAVHNFLGVHHKPQFETRTWGQLPKT